MRHQKKQLKLNMQRDERAALIRNMATSVILFEKVKTTVARAKAVRPVVEDLITKAKTKDTREAIRQISKIVFDEKASRKLLEVLKERYKEREGGYTRVVKMGRRIGDAAEVVQIQLV
jgi:large subunit ribosomal protein L17